MGHTGCCSEIWRLTGKFPQDNSVKFTQIYWFKTPQRWSQRPLLNSVRIENPAHVVFLPHHCGGVQLVKVFLILKLKDATYSEEVCMCACVRACVRLKNITPQHNTLAAMAAAVVFFYRRKLWLMSPYKIKTCAHRRGHIWVWRKSKLQFKKIQNKGTDNISRINIFIIRTWELN